MRVRPRSNPVTVPWPYLIFLPLLIVPTFVTFHYPFVSDDPVLQWLVHDYVESGLPLIAILVIPTLRACVRTSFGPLVWPPPPARRVTLFGVICLCVVLDEIVWWILHPSLLSVLPDTRTETYPFIQDTALVDRI